MHRKYLISLTALAAACSGSAVSVSGNFNGYTMDAQEALSAYLDLQMDANDISHTLTVMITDHAGTCASLEQGRLPDTMESLILELGVVDPITYGEDRPTTPGTYIVGADGLGSNTVAVGFNKTNAQCQSGDRSGGLSGTVTITDIDIAKGTVSGSFNIILDSGAGDLITGTFSTASCSSIASTIVTDIIGLPDTSSTGLACW